MSVIVVPIGSRLTLRLNTGLDENMNPVFRTRSWSNLKPTVSNEDVHEIGVQLGSLQVHTIDTIRRADENELSSV